ncbi:MAG: PhoPQ-activated pathogenicity-related family protein [Candidatus Bipolaricaulota bacterium]|nr:PhoPQ-activated pathogenicity-related family protein [Candidatus Bipolaricaulota bacterium]
MKGQMLLVVVVLTEVLALAGPPTDLLDYLQATKGSARWEVVEGQGGGAGGRVEIRLRSQVWRGIPWDHTLTVYEPPAVVAPDVIVLFISGDASRADALLGTAAAAFSGLRVAILTGVPNQPLFGLREDALIAHTFARYLAEGDPDWPLLLPMVRSAHAAMEALDALAPELWGTKLRGFVVSGASKRGWTTYLTAATAPERVLGIAPIVFDFLNFPAQLAAHGEALGGPSPMLQDYTARGLTGMFGASPASARLAWLVDPYSYRYALTMPKLVVVGANDPYWTVDATSLYWPGLPDPKLLLVVPNAGHEVPDFTRVVGSVAAFARLLAKGEPLPAVESSLRFRSEGAVLTVRAGREPAEVRLWVAESPSRNFHEARWVPTELPGGEGKWEVSVAPPVGGYRAFFAELTFEVGGLRLYTSTPTRVLGP